MSLIPPEPSMRGRSGHWGTAEMHTPTEYRQHGIGIIRIRTTSTSITAAMNIWPCLLEKGLKLT